MAGHLVPSEAHLQAACYAKSGFDFAHLTELANQALGSTYDSARSSAFTHSGFDAPGGGCSSQPTQAGWQSAEGSQDEELSGASPGESEANPNAEPRRLKVMHAKVLSAKEKAERRKEGNRIAAQRLRKKRVETKNALVEEVTRLQAEQARYKAHMAHMASGCQSVVMENHELRRELEALRASAACQMKDPNFANPLPLFGSLSAHHAAELNNLGPSLQGMPPSSPAALPHGASQHAHHAEQSGPHSAHHSPSHQGAQQALHSTAQRAQHQHRLACSSLPELPHEAPSGIWSAHQFLAGARAVDHLPPQLPEQPISCDPVAQAPDSLHV